MVYYTVSRYNEDMFLVGILSWWYNGGWRRRIQMIQASVTRTSDYFSVGLLLKTLFSPYRQISAGSMSGPLGIQMQALVDNIISRLIGALIRSTVMITGCIVITLQILIGCIVLVLWPFVPLFPIIGIILTIIGVAPSW